MNTLQTLLAEQQALSDKIAAAKAALASERDGDLATVRLLIAKHGLAKTDVFPSDPVPIRYRDTANPENVWTGRGYAPKWLTKYEAIGMPRATFEVKPAT